MPEFEVAGENGQQLVPKTPARLNPRERQTLTQVSGIISTEKSLCSQFAAVSGFLHHDESNFLSTGTEKRDAREAANIVEALDGLRDCALWTIFVDHVRPEPSVVVDRPSTTNLSRVAWTGNSTVGIVVRVRWDNRRVRANCRLVSTQRSYHAREEMNSRQNSSATPATV